MLKLNKTTFATAMGKKSYKKKKVIKTKLTQASALKHFAVFAGFFVCLVFFLTEVTHC